MKSPRKASAKRPRASAVPSRDDIIAFLSSEEGESSKRDIARAFGVKGHDRIELKRILRELTEEGVISGPKGKIRERGRLPPVAVLDIIDQDTDGELIAKPAKWDEEGEAPRVRLAPLGHETFRPALGIGERVLARIERDEDGAFTAYAKKRLGQSAHDVLGVLRRGAGGLRVQPVDRKARSELQIAPSHSAGAEDGELVLCEVLPHGGTGLKRGRVKERLGPLDAPHAISLISIHAHGLPNVFPIEAIEEARAAEPPTLAGREDMRAIPLITIDPEDARDHDDAVYAEPDPSTDNPGGFIVWVAIADVATYVRPASALDRQALRRGNSVYFPDRVVPMLPEELSAVLCSLKEGETRATLAVRMVFSAGGEKRSHKFVRGLMRSAARLTYGDVQRAWDGAGTEKTRPIEERVLRPLFAAYGALKAAREARSPLDLDLPEHRISFSADGQIAEVKPRERLESMRLIEEFMIQANVAAAETLEAKRTPLLYRVHAEPDEEKLKAFKEFIESLDLTLPLGQTIRAQNFNRLLRAAQGTDYEAMLHEVILRTQAQAVYAPVNVGHFGLNLRRYAHFTSPIRRYADLTVHRALIKACGLGPDGQSEDEAARLGEIGEAISQAERRAMAAERDATGRYLAAFLKDRIGGAFEGRISGVTRFGLFVRLRETGADGLVPIRSIGNDYFIHDERTHALIGEVSGAIYRLGEPVTVRLIEAAPVTGGLVFELISEPITYRASKGARRAKAAVKAKTARRKPAGRRPG